MNYKSNTLGKYKLITLKVGKTLYFPVSEWGKLRSACYNCKRKHGLEFKVNKIVDEKGKEFIAVKRMK